MEIFKLLGSTFCAPQATFLICLPNKVDAGIVDLHIGNCAAYYSIGIFPINGYNNLHT